MLETVSSPRLTYIGSEERHKPPLHYSLVPADKCYRIIVTRLASCHGTRHRRSHRELPLKRFLLSTFNCDLQLQLQAFSPFNLCLSLQPYTGFSLKSSARQVYTLPPS